MEKHNLVVLKTSEPFFWEDEVLYPNKPYRCLKPIDSGSDTDYMIYALWFTQEEYEMYFELAYDKVMRDWKAIGLVNEDGSKITFAEFKRKINVHTYGKQTNNLRIGFAGVPRESQYGFYPFTACNKQLQLKEMYSAYEYVLNGNMYYLDNHYVKMGFKGVPISYVRQ